jgi:hypothetical protein
MCSFHKIFISTQFTPIEIIYKKIYTQRKTTLAHTKNKKRGDNIFTFSKQGMVGIGLAL